MSDVLRSVMVTSALALGLTKCVAYLVEMVWFAMRGPTTLLPAYRLDPERTYIKDREVGRPCLFTRKSGSPDAGRGWRLWGATFKTPVVVVLVFLGACFARDSTPLALSAGLAGTATVLGVSILIVPVVARLVLGPYDALNPDLRLPEHLRAVVYPGRRTVLGVYVLVLIAMAVLAYASAYLALSHIHGVFRSSSDGLDPVQALYTAVSVSATEGLGDAAVCSDWSRSVVASQMVLGPIALAWIAASFFGDELPDLRKGS